MSPKKDPTSETPIDSPLDSPLASLSINPKAVNLDPVNPDDPTTPPPEDEMKSQCMNISVIQETEVERVNNPYDCDCDDGCTCDVKKNKSQTDECGFIGSSDQLRRILLALMPTDQSSADFTMLIDQTIEKVIAAQTAANSSGVPGAPALKWKLTFCVNFLWWRICIVITSK